MKKILIALILIALILASVTLLSVPRVKADTSEAKVLSYSWYVAPSNTVQAQYVGDLVAVGEVQNMGSNVIGYVIVAGYAYNSTGQVVASTEAEAFGTDLLPLQKAPFYLDFAPQNSETQDQSWVPSVSNITVFVVYVNDTTETPYSGLVISNESVSAQLDNTGTYTITGTVQNTGNRATGNAWVVSTFYNGSGSVVALNFTNYLSNSLSPGNVVRFTATPSDNTAKLSSQITNYSLLVQFLPLTSSASSSPSASPSPLSSSSQGTSTNPTQSPVSTSSGPIYAVAGVIAIILVALGAMLLLRKRHKNAQFEPPPPPPPPPP